MIYPSQRQYYFQRYDINVAENMDLFRQIGLIILWIYILAHILFLPMEFVAVAVTYDPALKIEFAFLMFAFFCKYLLIIHMRLILGENANEITYIKLLILGFLIVTSIVGSTVLVYLADDIMQKIHLGNLWHTPYICMNIFFNLF